MVSGDVPSVCPIHLHFSSLFHFHLVNFQSVVLVTLSDHFRCRILRRHLLINVYNLVSVFCVLRHVADP